VGTYNMVEALRANAELFEKFGGHFFAAGYTLPTERWDELRRGLNRFYAESKAEGASRAAQLAEVVLTDLQKVDQGLLDQLELLEPHGSGNARPVWELQGLTLERLATMGRDGNHLRLRLVDGGGRSVTAVGFGMAPAHGALRPGQPVTLLGELNKNEYQGTTVLQVVLSEIRYE
jgi:single-stranded-DNA-specific exonuclease